jgi:hypothetical protein
VNGLLGAAKTSPQKKWGTRHLVNEPQMKKRGEGMEVDRHFKFVRLRGINIHA